MECLWRYDLCNNMVVSKWKARIFLSYNIRSSGWRINNNVTLQSIGIFYQAYPQHTVGYCLILVTNFKGQLSLRNCQSDVTFSDDCNCLFLYYHGHRIHYSLAVSGITGFGLFSVSELVTNHQTHADGPCIDGNGSNEWHYHHFCYYF